VSDSIDWKKKHLETLREVEADEQRWRALEQVLRRLVTRLCSVAMGDDPRLDAQLEKLAVASRRDSDAVELRALCDSLTEAVMAVDVAAPADRTPRPVAGARADFSSPTGPTVATLAAVPSPPARRWEASCAAVTLLLDRLEPMDPAGESVGPLRAELVAAGDDVALGRVLAGVAELVAERAETLARERSEAAAMLAQVTERLDEMAVYLATASEERAAQHGESQSMNLDVLAEVDQLNEEVVLANDLPALRGLVARRLEAVAANVRSFREREEHRYVEHVARTERMRSRIVELEQETRDLHRNLDLERRRARLDSLTKVANRTSFDERFAEELARFSRFRTPVAVLVWDVDLFKSINDQCGHRAGDAVLREVAACLGRGRRAIDYLARIGGEEFVTLLVGTSMDEAAPVAQQMRQSVEALRFHFRGTPIRVTVSCGLTELREGDTAATVFDRADAALYRAKHGGRNLCVAA
jgi:diguanylate cyclase